MSAEFALLSDAEIAAQIRAGMVPQATLRVQARQMKALDRIADALETLVAEFRPATATSGFASGEVYKPEVAEQTEVSVTVPIGPATDLEDAGTPRVRRRRHSGEGD